MSKDFLGAEAWTHILPGQSTASRLSRAIEDARETQEQRLDSSSFDLVRKLIAECSEIQRWVLVCDCAELMEDVHLSMALDDIARSIGCRLERLK